MSVGTWRARSGARRAVVVATAAALLAGCADFSGSEAAPFTGPPTGQVTTKRPTTPSQKPKFPGPCVDMDRAVTATCLDTPTTVIPTDTAEHSIVAQRNGLITYTTTDQPSREMLRLEVDTSGDGGLASIALSPTYDEDRLIFALISTPTDNRVVRVAQGDVPKVIFTGIPKGRTGNMGSLLWTRQGLVVASGNAGDPAAAADPNSLAGKVFLLEGHGASQPATARVLANNGGVRSSLCKQWGDSDAPLYVADDNGRSGDTLRVVYPARPAETVWTWADRPGALGCGVAGDWVGVSQRGADNVYWVKIKPGSATAEQDPVRMSVEQGRTFGSFGRIGGGSDPTTVLAGTINKSVGAPSPTDDRVVLLTPPDPASTSEGPD